MSTENAKPKKIISPKVKILRRDQRQDPPAPRPNGQAHQGAQTPALGQNSDAQPVAKKKIDFELRYVGSKNAVLQINEDEDDNLIFDEDKEVTIKENFGRVLPLPPWAAREREKGKAAEAVPARVPTRVPVPARAPLALESIAKPAPIPQAAHLAIPDQLRRPLAAPSLEQKRGKRILPAVSLFGVFGCALILVGGAGVWLLRSFDQTEQVDRLSAGGVDSRDVASAGRSSTGQSSASQSSGSGALPADRAPQIVSRPEASTLILAPTTERRTPQPQEPQAASSQVAQTPASLERGSSAARGSGGGETGAGTSVLAAAILPDTEAPEHEESQPETPVTQTPVTQTPATQTAALTPTPAPARTAAVQSQKPARSEPAPAASQPQNLAPPAATLTADQKLSRRFVLLQVAQANLTPAQKQNPRGGAIPAQPYVQLAALSSAEAARAHEKQLRAKSPDLFDGLFFVSRRAEVKGKIYYRLLLGPFINLPTARDLCNELKTRGLNCIARQQ